MKEPCRRDAEVFCNLCEWVHQCWSMNLAAFEHLTSPKAPNLHPIPWECFLKFPAGRFVGHHLELSNAYTLMQMAKLHDKPTDRNTSVTIDWFAIPDWWCEETRAEICDIHQALDEFYVKHLKLVRNKILAHSDQAVYSRNKILGEFEYREGEEYFQNLGRLASKIWTRWKCKAPAPWQGSERAFEFTPDSSWRETHRQICERVGEHIRKDISFAQV